LFLVPKFKVNDDGSIGSKNGISTGSIESKIGNQRFCHLCIKF